MDLQMNWSLIASIVLGSAVLAYLGDVLGFKYGKQRISLFGLRPKYTSRIITALTGIFISVVVLTVLSFFSDNVRTALFTMKYIQKQLLEQMVELQKARSDLENSKQEAAMASLELTDSKDRLRDQLALLQTTALSLDLARFDLETLRNDKDLLVSEKNDLEASVLSLREESEELKRELSLMRSEKIAVQANALLAQTVIPANTPRNKLNAILTELEGAARVVLAEKFSEKQMTLSEDIHLVLNPMEESEVIMHTENAEERMYVRMLAAENIAFGESVRVRFVFGGSFLLYDKGEVIYRKLVDPHQTGFNAEDTLHAFLRDLKISAIRNGVLPDPATNSVGSLEGETFFDAVERLSAIEDPVIINATALEPVYTEGPIRIKIDFQE